MQKKLRILVASLLMLVMAVGCAGQNNAGSGNSSAAGKDLLSEIIARGELRIGTYLQYKPLMFKNEQDEPDGFDIDIGKALAEAMGVKATFVDSSWDGIIPGLLADKYDIVISAMSSTNDRALVVTFSEPYYYHSAAFAYRSEDKDRFANLEDFNNASVSMIVADASHQQMARFFPDAELHDFNTADEAMLAMQTGKVDASVASTLYVMQYVEEHPGLEIREIDYPGSALPGAMAFRPGPETEHFRSFVNLFLRNLKDSGQYDEIYYKWFPELEAPDRIGW